MAQLWCGIKQVSTKRSSTWLLPHSWMFCQPLGPICSAGVLSIQSYLGTGWNLSDWAGNGFQSNFQLKLSRHLSRHSQGCISQMAISQHGIKSLIRNRLCLGESEGYRPYSFVGLECNYDFWGRVRTNHCICQIYWKTTISHAIQWVSDIPASTTMQIPTVTADTAVWIVMPQQRVVLPSSTACLHSVRSPNIYQELLKLIKLNN